MQVKRTLPLSQCHNIISWLVDISSYLEKDVSRYAPNRQKIWLNTEPVLYGNGRVTKPSKLQSAAAFERLQKILEIDFDFCLITYSGSEATGIDFHRDATFAAKIAYGLNLGDCDFYWNPDRHEENANKDNSDLWQLKMGDFVEFDCKHRHAAVPWPNRWGLNFWFKR